MLIGFVVALTMVSSHFNTAHKQIGLVVVIIGALQVCALPPVCVLLGSTTLFLAWHAAAAECVCATAQDSGRGAYAYSGGVGVSA